MLILYHTSGISSAVVSLHILCYVRPTRHDHLIYLVHLQLWVCTETPTSELSTTLSQLLWYAALCPTK